MLLPLILSVLGVAAMVGLTWLLGGLGSAVLVDRDAALDLMRRDFNAFEAGDAILAVDGTSALLAPVEGEKVGVVFAMGQHFATRLLSCGDVISVTTVPAKPKVGSAARLRGVCLELRLADFTQPRLRLELPDADGARRWRSRLEALREPAESRGV